MSMALGEEDPAPAPQYIQNLLIDLGSEFSKKESRIQLVERQLKETTEALKIARYDCHREESLRLEAQSSNASIQQEIRETEASNASLIIQIRELQTTVTSLKRQVNGGISKCLSTPPSSSANASFEGATALDGAGTGRSQLGRSERSTPAGRDSEAAWQILSNVHADAAEEDARVKDEERRFLQERARAWEEKQRLKSTSKASGPASSGGASGTTREQNQVSKTTAGMEDGSSIRPLSIDDQGPNCTPSLPTPATQPAFRKPKVQYLDVSNLCCYLCKRTFKTFVQLKNHTNSERHRQSLTDPRHFAKAVARMAKRARDAAKGMQAQGRDDYVQVGDGAGPSTSGRPTGEFDRGAAQASSLARSLSGEIISSNADDPMDEDYEGSFSCDGSTHES